MNRTFLILLMVGSAMLIAVIGEKNPTMQHEYTPWNTSRTENGLINAFGITLGETTIKESELILGKNPVTQLRISSNDDTGQQYELIAIYKDLLLSGVVSELILSYQLEQGTLQTLFSTLTIQPENKQSYSISTELAAPYLITPISSITYIPSINYGEAIIMQRFGSPEKERIISDTHRKWLYPEMGLEIQLHSNQSERFIYTNSEVN